MRKLVLTACLGLGLAAAAAAQDVYFEKVEVPGTYQPLYPSLQQTATFDVKAYLTESASESFLPAREVEDLKSIFSSPMKVKFSKFQQVDSTGDLHVIALVQRFRWVGVDGAGNYTGAVNLHLTVYDKFGAVYYDDNEELAAVTVPNERTWSASLNRKDPKTRVLLLTQEAISQSLQTMTRLIYGFEAPMETSFSWLSAGRKMADLQEFTKQRDLIRPVFRKAGGAENFVKTAEPFLAYWEKMTRYSGEGNALNVKRAAFHNLALFYILKGDDDKAQQLLADYKAIDVVEKADFGLTSFRYSERLETFLKKRNGTREVEQPKSTSDKPLTLTDVFGQHQFITIDGTIELDGRTSGKYTGTIKIKRPEPPLPASASRSNIVSLGGASNYSVGVFAKDASGKPKSFWVWSSAVKSLQASDGTGYVFRKYGSAALGGASFYLLKSSYQSPKVTVFTSMLPEEGQYVIFKSGDEKGVKSSLINARKNVLDYLKECPALESKYKAESAKFDIMQVAQDYTNCGK